MMTAVEREFKEIKKFLKLLVTSLSGGLTVVSSIFPVSGFFWKSLAPPWPPGSPVIPALAAAFTVLALFLTFRVHKEATIRLWSSILWVGGIVLVLVYLLLAAIYLDEVDGRVHLTGFALTEVAEQAIRDPQGPRNTTKDLLADFGYDSEDVIWTGRPTLKWLLLVLCSIGSASCAGGFSLLLVATIVNQKEAELRERAAVKAPLPDI